MDIPTIAFDESGNSGQELLNPDQPIYSLASIRFADGEGSSLLGVLPTGLAKEAHFSRLKKSPAGRVGIVDFLNSDLLTKGRAKVSIYDKPFMATAKMVDVLIETYLYDKGIDLYKDGQNRALANLWHLVMPSLIGESRFRYIQQMFVTMMRQRQPSDVEAFYGGVSDVLDSLEADASSGHVAQLELLIATRSIIDEALSGSELTLLDPAISTFTLQCACWTGQINEPFNVLHDNSKAIKQEVELLERLVRTHKEPQKYDYFGETAVFPMRAITPFVFGDSKDYPAIQAADLLAGASAYWMRGILYGPQDDFWHSINDSRLKDVAFDIQSAVPEFTAEELGTQGVSHTEMLEHIGDIIGSE